MRLPWRVKIKQGPRAGEYGVPQSLIEYRLEDGTLSQSYRLVTDDGAEAQVPVGHCELVRMPT
jgi:hypothetical protein